MAARAAFTETLKGAGQGHVFEGDAADVEARLVQLEDCEKKYSGGLGLYVDNARKLLGASARGENPLEGWTFDKVPNGELLEPKTDAHDTMEAVGLEAIGDCSFVLVAGGLGERLGYGGIKVALPSETTSGRVYMQLYVETILAYQAHARAVRDEPTLILPLAIMTSADTNDRTAALLKANGNFGMADGQITLLMQGKVPAIMDNDGKIALSADGKKVLTKPHGHGDIHSLLHMSGTAAKWLADGNKYMFIFQDTNAFALRSLLPALGVTVTHGFEFNSVTVPRKAGEAIGAICTLKGPAGESLTINVEYNQIDAMLKANGLDGDVNNEAGFSPFPGSINELLFTLPEYVAVLARSGGQVPEFVNPKYADATKTLFKSPTRLECMMQDYPKLLSNEAKVGFSSLCRKAQKQYSPVKNNVVDAKKKQESGLDPACALSGEMELYRFNLDLMSQGGIEIPADDAMPVHEFYGIKARVPPAVSLAPSFLLGAADAKAKVVGGSISARSTLIVQGECRNVTLQNVHLDGALVLTVTNADAHVVIKDVTITNKGWEFVALSEAELAGDVEESIRIRGYKVVKHEQLELAYAEAGSHEYSGEEEPETTVVTHEDGTTVTVTTTAKSTTTTVKHSDGTEVTVSTSA